MTEENTGRKIRALRAKLGLNQEDIADACGVSRQSVSKWEQGSAIPNRTSLMTLCSKFGVPYEYFSAPDIKTALEILDGCDFGSKQAEDLPPETAATEIVPPEEKPKRKSHKGLIVALIICAAIFVTMIVWLIVKMIESRKYYTVASSVTIHIAYLDIVILLVSIAALVAGIVLARIIIKRRGKKK